MTRYRFSTWLVSSLFCLVVIPTLHADDIGDAVKQAKAKHAAEMARLHQTTLDEIDTIIRREQDAGVVVNFYLKERKGFAENGILPLLPKLLPPTKGYADGKKLADAALETAYSQAIEDYRKAKQFDQALSLKLDLQKLKGQAPAVTPKMPPDVVVRKDEQPTTKDAKIEADIARTKGQYTTSMKAAATGLLNDLEEQRTKVATSKTLTNDEKLKNLDALTKEKLLFEAGVTLPKSAAMKAGLKQYEEAITKPRQTFATAMDAAASAYIERKDTGNAQAVIAEKKRLLMRPNSLDLLSLVDVKQDAETGTWSLKDGVLMLVNPAEVSVIQLPYEPGAVYNLHLRAERLEGTGYLSVGLVASGRQATCMFNGWPEAGGRSGLQLVDGKYLPDNPTLVTGHQLPLRKPTLIDVAVRKDAIMAWVKTPDDKEPRQIVNFTGNHDRLSVEQEWVKLKNKKVLFLHQHTSKFAITEVTLEFVGKDEGKPIR